MAQLSQQSHWTGLWQNRCKDHSRLYSLYNTKLHHQIYFLTVHRHQVFSMMRGSFFHITHNQGLYLMHCSTFCISRTETWVCFVGHCGWGGSVGTPAFCITCVDVSCLMSTAAMSHKLRQLMCARRGMWFACRVLPITFFQTFGV